MLICTVTKHSCKSLNKVDYNYLATNCKYDLLLQHLCNNHTATRDVGSTTNWELINFSVTPIENWTKDLSFILAGYSTTDLLAWADGWSIQLFSPTDHSFIQHIAQVGYNIYQPSLSNRHSYYWLLDLADPDN